MKGKNKMTCHIPISQDEDYVYRHFCKFPTEFLMDRLNKANYFTYTLEYKVERNKYIAEYFGIMRILSERITNESNNR